MSDSLHCTNIMDELKLTLDSRHRRTGQSLLSVEFSFGDALGNVGFSAIWTISAWPRCLAAVLLVTWWLGG